MADKLEALLADGTDSAQLRFGLATSYVGDGQPERALQHVKFAVDMDPDYSAAWRLLGQVYSDLGQVDESKQAFERGIEIAERRGDQQLVKEMSVFLRRLSKAP